MGRNYSEEFKQEVIAASYVDGVSVASVASRFKVTDSSIYYWRKRLQNRLKENNDPVPAVSPGFIPISVCTDDVQPDSLKVKQPQIQNSWHVMIVMGSDRRIEIDGAFELPDLIKLIRGVAV